MIKSKWGHSANHGESVKSHQRLEGLQRQIINSAIAIFLFEFLDFLVGISQYSDGNI